MGVQDISAKDFEKEVLNSEGYVLVDFWAPWCMPCRMMAPVLEELSTDPELSKNLKIRKINTEEPENQPLAYSLQIMSIPNLKLFYKGKIVEDFIGYRTTSQFKAELLTTIGK
jgi:thioredoxin 1